MPNLIAVVCVALDQRADPAGLKTFKSCLSACPNVESALEVTGTYDLILKVNLESLEEYQAKLDRMASQLHQYVARMDTNFVCRASEKKGDGAFFWVPCSDGHRRLDVDRVVKITAEGDYMRIHTDAESHLVHDTMQHLCGILKSDAFIQLHRSCMVRCDCVDRLIHHTRTWVVRLKDGTEQRVSKSRVNEVMQKLGLTMHQPTSSISELVVDNRPRMNELAANTPAK